MTTQVRIGVFETNSSSTHSLCICTKEEYDAFKKGKLVMDTGDYKMVDATKKDKEDDDESFFRYKNYSEFKDADIFNYEYMPPGAKKPIVILVGEFND